MVGELLRYHPANESYDAWLGRSTELVNAPGEAPTPSLSLHPPPSHAGDMAQSAPPPSRLRGDDTEPRSEARPRDPPRGVLTPVQDEASCQVVQ